MAGLGKGRGARGWGQTFTRGLFPGDVIEKRHGSWFKFNHVVGVKVKVTGGRHLGLSLRLPSLPIRGYAVEDY